MAMTRCPWCLLPTDEDVCPHCGHARSSYTPDSHQISPGAMLRGRYVVGRVLGEGGFGITYAGYDETLERRVAIKEYYPLGIATRYATTGNNVVTMVTGGADLFSNGRNAFLEEARVMARVSGHDALVGVTDYFKDNGTAYIIMDYVDGVSLATYCEQHGGKIEFDELMRIIGPVFDGLGVLHAAGLVHRDISPDNIMVSGTGTRLIDFGCAREYAGDGERTMTVMLKYDFAAPEQYGRGGQGPWTDVYALSATIYRCLTGVLPPRAMDRLGGTEFTSVSDLGVKIPANADLALAKGLEMQAQDRYQSMEELRRGLLGEDKELRRSRMQLTGIIAVAAVVIVAILAGGLLMARHASRRASEETAQVEQAGLTTEGVAYAMARVSAGDMHTVVIDADGNVQSTQMLDQKEDLGQCDVGDLKDAVAVSAGRQHTAALDADGHVKAVGDDHLGQCDVDTWEVISIACGMNHTVGLKADGTVVATGMNEQGQLEVGDWTDIVAVAAGDGHTVGLRADGTVVAVGLDTYGQCDVDGWTDIVAIDAGMAHTLGVRADGTVVSTEIPESESSLDKGQCEVDGWSDIVAVSAGRYHSVGLRSDGTLVTAGSQKNGMCNVSGWTDVRAVSAGADHTVALLADGSVKATGSPANGQLDVEGMSWGGDA